MNSNRDREAPFAHHASRSYRAHAVRNIVFRFILSLLLRARMAPVRS